jgi:FixJ family two-component response regulator
MSLRALTMIDAKEALRRWVAGQSARQIARDGVVSRRTREPIHRGRDITRAGTERRAD